MQKYRKYEAKRSAQNRRQAKERKKKNESVTLTEEKQEKRKNAREWEILSQANIDDNSPCQEYAGRKVKDKNHKRKSRNQEKF